MTPERDPDPIIINVTERERPPRLRCGKWMRLAKEPCARRPGHKGDHETPGCRTAYALENDAARQRRWHQQRRVIERV